MVHGDLAATGRPRGRPGSPTRPAQSGQEWLSWEQAAAFVGCPVATIDWHTRTGRIASRPRLGARPTVNAANLNEFKAWWTAREQRRAATSPQRATRRERDARRGSRATAAGENEEMLPPGVWVSLTQAGQRLGRSTATVRRRVATSQLTGIRCDGRWWVNEQSLSILVDQERQWVSAAAAARIVGCSIYTIRTAIDHGHLLQRDTTAGTALPSLDRPSVEEYKEFRSRQERRRRQAQRLRVQRAEQRRTDLGPPNDGNVWLDTHTVALLLSVTRGRVAQLAAADRIPHFRSPSGRLWFRRDHAEQTAAARRHRN